MLGRDRNGNLFARQADQYRSLRAEETRQLRGLLALVDGTGLTEARAGAKSYSVRVPELGRVRVTLVESAAGAHGRHR